tara:strand:+ start:229 stop:1128 length:900 start_codon:yes stop_codon:yes gene_type:complete
MRLVKTPSASAFAEVIASANADLLLCSPYVGIGPCESIRDNAKPNVAVTLLCDLRIQTVLSGATRPAAISALLERDGPTQVLFAAGVHAKIYIADQRYAMITSANLTNSGLCRNFEYGVLLDDRNAISEISEDIRAIMPLSTPVSQPDLDWMETVYQERGHMVRFVNDHLGLRILNNMTAGIAEAHERFLRISARGRPPHAIFADAILHSLVRGPLTTPEIHGRVQAIHPDICDDSIDRVIDGKHFGKKWKHAVRTAQQHLKKAGKIVRDGKYWVLVESPTRPRQSSRNGPLRLDESND